MSAGVCFACAPGYEDLAAELAELVNGSWEVTHGVAGVVLMANAATVPRVLPSHASQRALEWWEKSVAVLVARPVLARS